MFFVHILNKSAHVGYILPTHQGPKTQGREGMHYKVKTTLTSQEALEQAKTYFGPGGQGLAIVSQSSHTLRLRGRNGGHINMTAKHRLTTKLELETRAWDEAVRQFMAQLPPARPWWQLWRRSGKPATSSAA